MLAQADQHHLVQARFDLARESRVRLDAAGHDHVIALEGIAIEVHRESLRRPVDDDRLHRRADLGPVYSSVIPYDSTIARCPSAVPPPWLPIAGMITGLAPSLRT